MYFLVAKSQSLTGVRDPDFCGKSEKYLSQVIVSVSVLFTPCLSDMKFLSSVIVPELIEASLIWGVAG